MVGQEVVKLDIKLQKMFLDYVKKGFQSQNNDEVGNTLDIIGFLCVLKDGIKLLGSDKQIF